MPNYVADGGRHEQAERERLPLPPAVRFGGPFCGVTGPDYGRIYDHELVVAVQRIAGNGKGDTRWKVPGVLDWTTSVYNPLVDITQNTTTLYASNWDVFLFLVDDLNPIEAVRLPGGSPDLYFRGFYCWSPEVGAKTLGIASFYLRAVCQNCNLWALRTSRRPPSGTRNTPPPASRTRRRPRRLRPRCLAGAYRRRS